MAEPAYLANNNAELARLIKDGAIFIREAGASNIPTSTAWTPTSGDGQIGYYSEDGFTVTPVPGDATDLGSHNGDTVISEQAPGHWTFSFQGIEGNKTITAAYFDIDPDAIDSNGNVTVAKASNSKRYDLVLVGLDQSERVIVIHVPNAQISEKEALTFNKDTLLAYGLTFRTFKGGSSAPYHFKAFGLAVDEAGSSSASSSAESSSVA